VVTGAIIALGDSLFLQIGLTPEQSPVVAGILALRLTPPPTSIIVGLYWMFVARYSAVARPAPGVLKSARFLIIVILLTWVAGFVNNWLHAPTWLQVLHLFLADLFWLGIVWHSAAALAVDAPRAAKVKMAQVFSS
jgi:hypothetical protein